MIYSAIVSSIVVLVMEEIPNFVMNSTSTLSERFLFMANIDNLLDVRGDISRRALYLL